MQNELKERRNTLAFFFIVGIVLFAIFVGQSLFGDPVVAMVSGLAGMAFMAVFLILFIDITTKADAR